MNLSFSIVSPTIQRESLVACCLSVDEQTFKEWSHIVMVDCDEFNEELIAKIRHPQRQIYLVTPPSHNYGNTPRHIGWLHATGTYQYVLDDDNVLADSNALKRIASSLKSANYPDWAIFPIVRHSRHFFNDPPGLCQTDTGNVVVKREIGRWPNIEDYTADGIWTESLKEKYPYAAFPNVFPIMVMEKSSEGK